MNLSRSALVGAFVLTGIAIVACGDDDSNGSSSGNATASGGASGNGGSSGFGSNGGNGGGDGGQSSGSNGTSGSNGGLDGCATTSKKAEKQPVDMVIGLDTSFSMDFDDKWVNVRDAMRAFVSNPNYSDLGVGLQFFPGRKACSVPDYTALAVPLAIQAEARDPITAQLASQRMAGGTPMVPLLEGLTGYLRTNAKPGRKPVIVLATDGFPDDTCLSPMDGHKSNTLENAVQVAKDALAANPSVPTFVIGVGSELEALDAIAAAGGTTKATLVDTSINARQAFLDALEAIRKTAIPCDYDIPAGAIDVLQTNVTYTTKEGGVRQMVYVKDAAGCGLAANGEGWYFDNEADPKKVIICQTVCDVLKAKDDGASVDLVFGCPRNDVR